MRQQRRFNERTVRKLGFSGAAFFAQGAWALYANWDHGARVAWQAAILHGMLCFGLTLVSSAIVEFFYGLTKWRMLKTTLPVIGTALVMLSLSGALHWFNGTPDIVSTLAPLLLLGVPYYVLYTFLLVKADKKKRLIHDYAE